MVTTNKGSQVSRVSASDVAMVRLQIEWPEAALLRLDNMKSVLGVSSRSEVIRRALGVYEWLVITANEGKGVTLDPLQLAMAVGLPPQGKDRTPEPPTESAHPSVLEEPRRKILFGE